MLKRIIGPFRTPLMSRDNPAFSSQATWIEFESTALPRKNCQLADPQIEVMREPGALSAMSDMPLARRSTTFLLILPGHATHAGSSDCQARSSCGGPHHGLTPRSAATTAAAL